MSVPAGWYPDSSGGQRWWDGVQWTEHYAPPPPPSQVHEPFGMANYIVAIFIPIIGIVLAVTRFAKNDMGNGVGLLLASVVAFGIWFALLSS